MSYPGQPPMGIPGMPPMPYMVGAPPSIIGGVMPMAHVRKSITLVHDNCVDIDKYFNINEFSIKLIIFTYM